jgi:16S rRNA (guanine527-N7)-methyltransferase
VNTPPFDREAFAAQIPVSRETLDKLDAYAALLAQWQTQMNLVGPATLPDVWHRHFLDSAQLMRLVPGFSQSRWLDVGAGGGFPGMVLAILGARQVHLVDSVAKKTRFLGAVQEALGLGAHVRVHTGRIEQLKPWPVDIITARAVAPLEKLFGWTERFWTSEVRGLFLKGESASEELTQARKSWTVTCSLHVSLSDPRGRIVDVGALRRASQRQKT